MNNPQWLDRLSTLLSEAVAMEHHGFYFYLAAAVHFDTPKVGLHNLRDFFYYESREELEHARRVIDYMNQRGLRLELTPIESEDLRACSIAEIFKRSEMLEQAVLDHYYKVQKEAGEAEDYVTTQFIDYYLDMQVREVKIFHDRRMNAERCSEPLGEFIFDQSFSKKK